MGINIKVARIKKGMKQDDLCKLISISRATLSKLENGECDPKRSLMIKISKALDATVQELFLDGVI